MTEEPLAQQLTTLRKLLDEVDARLAQAPVTPTGLEDLKHSVDVLRTSVWAIMSAGHGIRSRVLVERFRLRRAIQTIRAVSGKRAPTTRHPEHAELQAAARELADQIDTLP